ncbi:MAG TPA: NAD(P)/FAD-dependent oxidoreductase, partial [Candidatus Nanopelagicales bacterium]
MSDPRTFVIVGAGLAGAKAADTLCEEGFDGRVVLLGDEHHVPYARPPLSKGYLQGADQRESVLVHPADWFVEHDIDLRLGVPATGLDRHARAVVLADGTRVGYDALLLATGSSPRQLAVPGADLPGVHCLRTLDDSDRLKQGLARASRVVIIGGGWIGLEVAAAARQAGVEVTVLEQLPLPLLRVLGSEVAAIFADLHRSHGVDLRGNLNVRRLHAHAGRLAGVELGDGSRIDADLAVVGVGITPNTAIAEAAGLEVDNGVRVD